MKPRYHTGASSYRDVLNWDFWDDWDKNGMHTDVVLDWDDWDGNGMNIDL